MKKICVVTATRAEYGLLKRILQCIVQDRELELQLVVTGAHLSHRYGYTVEEIEKDGFEISHRIPILGEPTPEGICVTMGNASQLFGELFERHRPDMLIVEGDRYELLPICSAAMMMGIPIAHISGGEITQGAVDDVVRHCLTKMSYLHFPACEPYRRRIIQLGEEPERVFNFGDVGVENVRKMDFMFKEELEQSLGISLDKPYASVTFHPVTLELDCARRQTEELLAVIEGHKELLFIVTMANADANGDLINELFQNSAKGHSHIVCFASLGIRRYLSLLKYASFVLGNSSSGIVEAPCFGIPTINIGDRQKGRLRASSVLDCVPERGAIEDCIRAAMSEEFRSIAKCTKNPYGEGDTSAGIVRTIKEYLLQGKIDLKKKFYDIHV